MAANTARLVSAALVGALLTGCGAVAGNVEHPAPAGLPAGGPGTSFIEEAPPHWLRAADFTRDIAASATCRQLRDVMASVPVPPASAPGARYNAMAVPLYFSAASLRERSLGC